MIVEILELHVFYTLYIFMIFNIQFFDRNRRRYFSFCNKIMYVKFQQISGSCSAHCCVSISGSVLIDFVSLDFVSFYILTEKQHLSVVVGAAVVVNFSLRMFLQYLGNRPVQIKKKVEQIHPYIFTSIYCFITDSYFLFINILHITTCT